MVPPSVMPKGVEHWDSRPEPEGLELVPPSVMPKGVEHFLGPIGLVVEVLVPPSVMPKGVEHDRRPATNRDITERAPLSDAERR